jgi:hypothetical protein
MTFPKARLAVSAFLFVSWLLFLFVVWLRSSATILSKPQFVVAQLYIVADVRDERGKANPDVTVDEVLWAFDPADQDLVTKSLHIAELSTCPKQDGYQGAGKYLVPLVKATDGAYRIAPIPWAASRHATHGTIEVYGFFSHRVIRRLPINEALTMQKCLENAGFATSLKQEEIRIYPWRPSLRAQVEELVAAKN